MKNNSTNIILNIWTRKLSLWKLSGYFKDILDKQKFEPYEDLLGNFIISEVEIN